MKKILIYNTLKREKEEFKPINLGKLSFYYCGPTVYWTQHIGNLRGSLCADIVHRSFKYLNYDVSMVRNYTDVGHLSSDEDEGEDKMEKSAKKEDLKPEEIADKYIKAYEEDTKKLGILSPKFKPRATENIEEMIDLIQILLVKSYAYSTDLAIYFDISKFEDYTKLSGQKLEKNKMGAGRADTYDKDKRNPADFALWFFRADKHKNAIQYWPSPFFSPLVENGNGFPGWHLECSAMIKKFLGETIDIHMGGIEHVSVHHTNEIAQSEAANGVKLANYWLHNEHLLFNNAKMSKSEGTSYSLGEIESKGFKPLALRYFFLQAHYRSTQNFTFEALKAAQKGLTNIQEKIRKLGVEIGEVNQDLRDKFLKDLLDDFNVPKSLAIISDIFKSDMSDKDKLATLLDFDKVWGLYFSDILEEEGGELSSEVKNILEERDEARRNKDFRKSDDLRLKLEEMGYKVEDSSEATVLKK
jgi:cysteinyl-tRNA synthetase